MRARRTTRSIAVGLVGLLLLLSGLMYPAMVPHELHHAHHQAATHGTALCSWLCAAGQAADSLAPVVRVDLGPVALLDQIPLGEPERPARHARLSRAPPPPVS